MNGMIAEANREIRWQLWVAERRRQDRAKGIVPFSYVDSLIAELEAMHLDGLRAVPASFLARLLAVNRLLPGGIEPLLGWGCRIRDAIGQCFELQEPSWPCVTRAMSSALRRTKKRTAISGRIWRPE